MHEKKFVLSAAGNVFAPCWVTLKELGYSVTVDLSGEYEWWSAEKDGDRYNAEDPCQLLGLIKLVETRGKNWRVSDHHIENFVKIYEDHMQQR